MKVMQKRIGRAVFLCLLAAAALAGCTGYKVEAPEGFAELERQGRGRYRAVSPEGIQFSIKTEKNYPKQDLEYWQTAMRDHMERAGYTLISGPERFETVKQEGVYFEWAAPYQEKDYIYLTGLVVSGNRLLILEAGGELDEFRRYQDNILESLESISAR